MKEIDFGPKAARKIREIRRKNRPLFQKIQKQLALFQQNPRHPSLRTHKLSGELKDAWSISVDSGYRILYRNEGEIHYIFDLGIHDEIYRK